MFADPPGIFFHFVDRLKNIRMNLELDVDRVPVSVSKCLFGSFVLILFVMMSISPVSTVIFPKSETAMLSSLMLFLCIAISTLFNYILSFLLIHLDKKLYQRG